MGAGTGPDQYEARCVGDLVAHAADAARAAKASAWALDHLGRGAVVALEPPLGDGGGADVQTPIEMAPTPDHPWRAAFDDATIERALDHLSAEQADDGGWPIGWEPPSATAVAEWRGARTVDALRALVAYGRITR
jgi:hypothetical protein